MIFRAPAPFAVRSSGVLANVEVVAGDDVHAEASLTIATKHALQRAHNLLGVKAELRLFYLASSAA